MTMRNWNTLPDHTNKKAKKTKKQMVFLNTTYLKMPHLQALI
jgi:hypothetical protein